MTDYFQAARGVPNACQPLPNLITGGQPDRGDIQALAAAGVKVILDIRSPSEWRWMDEAEQARALGFTYYNIPVGPTPLNDELLASILRVLRTHKEAPMFFHCKSGNRVGGALLPYLILDEGIEEEDALAIARRVGLRSAEYARWGVEYARRHRTATGRP